MPINELWIPDRPNVFERRFLVARTPEYAIPDPLVEEHIVFLGFLSIGPGNKSTYIETTPYEVCLRVTHEDASIPSYRDELPDRMSENLGKYTGGMYIVKHRLEVPHETMGEVLPEDPEEPILNLAGDGIKLWYEEYKGALSPMVALDAVFPNAKAAAAFPMPEYARAEVTHNPEYADRNLVQFGIPDSYQSLGRPVDWS